MKPRLLSNCAGLVRGLVLVAVVTPAVLLAPLATFHALSAAHADMAVTVTGASHAYDYTDGSLYPTLPTATVSQTTNLVDQTIHVQWTGETPSTNDNTTPANGIPATFNSGSTYYGVGVFECKGADPTQFSDCFVATAGATAGNGGLGNAVDTLSYPDGTGFADLHVETGVTNSDLACDPTHDCSVAIVPAWGGVPATLSPSGVAACDNHTKDLSTKQDHYEPLDVTNTYDIGTQDCSWANRMVVPLHFAATPLNCPAASPSFSAVGSPMLERGLSQWQAGWCNGSSPLAFSYNSTPSEYEARTSFGSGGGALTSATNVALTTQPASAQNGTFTYAPIANTDIAIAFLIDDATTHHEITDINLNAELVAKLLTQSYAPQAYACLSGGDTTKQSATCDPAVKGNPQSILMDPQFLALNPQLSAADFPYVGASSFGAFFPTVVAGNSDLTYELTRWIASDAAARAFLAGKADTGDGMHVNSYYKGIHYPTSQLQELDPGYVITGAQAGTGTMQNTWQPVSGLDRVGTLLVGNTSTSLNNNAACNEPPCSLPKLVEPFGARALFAIMDQGQASAYDFPTAHLINAAGKAVAPSATSIAAGLAAAQPDKNGITRHADYTAHNSDIYPLTATDYAMVHTCGQSAGVASGVQSMLSKVSGSQTSGLVPGTLAPGYTALTSGQQSQLISARTLVSTRKCTAADAVSRHRAPTTKSHRSTTRDNRNSAGTGHGGAGGNSGAGGTTGRTTSTTGKNKAGTTTGKTANSTSGTTKPVAYTGKPDSAGAARYTLPILLGVGGLLLLGGPAVYLFLATESGSSLGAFVRRLRP